MTGSLDAGAGPCVAGLEAPLREALERSLADRLAGRPGAELNLDNAFWGAPAPRDLGEALTRLGPTGVNVVVRVFERIRDIDPALGLWGQIRYLRNVWHGGSAGFKVVYAEPAAMRERLDGHLSGPDGRRLVRDTVLGAIEHQRGTLLRSLRSHMAPILRGGEPRDADTWREVHRTDQEAVHLCVGKHEPRPPELDDIHLDWRSPVVGVNEATLRCRYGLVVSLVHWAQARFGLGKPAFPFQDIDERIAARAARSPAGRAPAEWEAFAARWRDARWRLATRGSEGAEEALRWLRECEALEAALAAG
ncbi:hypothetical protein SOCE26_074910 [Sorangium cellulosum]|uniref:Uncharacterized protein n=1 Tax=Sorangium cellulosum TaxID=56 RepID=A0A2L0F324_SORCE|nr:hypothetical protein [Sorangium cellulosum]AUX45988.1 hypothetical protein SOCE26_074910 [Sorangium cellulosum]